MSQADITLPQVRAFAAVVEAGSFTAAAERTGTTQSAVSQAVAGLENVLGLPLLHRDRGGATLTEVGERVLAHARSVLGGVERIRQEAAAANGLERGKLRIGSFASFTARLLPGIMRSFQLRHPGIELVLLEGSDAEVHEWLRARVVDVAAVTLPAEGVEVAAETRDEIVVVVPAGHRLATAERVSVRELEREPFIMPRGGCEALVYPVFQAARCAPRTSFEVLDTTTLLLMVQEGLGVTVFPRLAVPPNLPGLRLLSLDPPAWRRIGLAVNPGDPRTPAVAAFLREAIPHIPPVAAG